MSLVGLNKLHYAKLTKDDSTGVTYSTVTRIVGAIEADIEYQTNATTLYADDKAFAVATASGDIKLSLNVEDLPLDIRADLLGHTVKNGVMEIKGGDEPPYVAVLYESQKRDGSIRYMKLLKGKFQEPNDSAKTKTDTPEFTTPTIEGTFVNREYDGISVKMADSGIAAFTGAAKWYQSVEES